MGVKAYQERMSDYVAKAGISLAMPDPLLQRDVESFYRERFKVLPRAEGTLAAPEDNGAVVRAALACGWVKGIQAVDELKPGIVSWLANQVSRAIIKAYEVPGE